MSLLGDGAAPLTVTQGLLPYRGAPVYLRLTNTTKKADNYQAAGFHVSVARAQSGGCADPASAISGTDPKAACKTPLSNPALGALWESAAQGYLAAGSQLSLADRIAQLRAANAMADAAYAQEGVAPPTDPAVVAVGTAQGNGAEPVTRPRRRLALVLGALGAAMAGGIGYMIYDGQKKHAAYHGY